MKKLTKKYDDGSYGVADDLPFGENSYDFKNALILRLGCYEHSQLVPTAWPHKTYDLTTPESFIEFMIDHNISLGDMETLWERWVSFNYMSRDYIKKELGGDSYVI